MKTPVTAVTAASASAPAQALIQAPLSLTRSKLSQSSQPTARPGRPSPADSLYPKVKRSDLAAKCKLSEAHISRIMRGLAKPSVDVAVKIAAYLGVTVDKFLEEHHKTAKRHRLKVKNQERTKPST